VFAVAAPAEPWMRDEGWAAVVTREIFAVRCRAAARHRCGST
jgi:hypothetical protein